MIKAIIFDWGGVLIDETLGALDSYCASILKVDVDSYNLVRQKYLDDFALGNITENKFWQNVCDELDRDAPQSKSLWGDAVKVVFKKKPEIFKLINKLKKQGYKIGFLSNTEMPAVKYWQENDYAKYFDEVVFSCVEHVAKPDKEIYVLMCKRLNIVPQEAVFIDDKFDFIEGAKRVGMGGIIFKNCKQLKSDLKEIIDL